MAMLRLYRFLGDHQIVQASVWRRLGVSRKTWQRMIRCEVRVNPHRRHQVEAILRSLGVDVPDDLWKKDRCMQRHDFFLNDAPRVRSASGGVEPLDPNFQPRLPSGGQASTFNLQRLPEEVPMAQRISRDVLDKFKLSRDPFVNELQDASDVFMSKVHKRAAWLLNDAAAHQYFVALVGAVGAGKTVVLKAVLESMGKDPSFVVSRLRCVEKEEVNAYSIMEALVRDFSSEGPRHSREARARQIGAMLQQMIAEKRKPVLVIDEAHALNFRTLRALKRLYDETECGFRRSIGIIIVGQNSNVDKSYNLEDKLGNWDLREVSERCELMRLPGLGKELGDYLAWKFAKAGSKREIVKPDAVRLLAKTYDTPLAVNNVVSVAMNLAYEVGKTEITAELMADAIAAAQAGGRFREEG